MKRADGWLGEERVVLRIGQQAQRDPTAEALTQNGINFHQAQVQFRTECAGWRVGAMTKNG